MNVIWSITIICRMLNWQFLFQVCVYHLRKRLPYKCECGQDKESVPHILLHCGRFVEAGYKMEDAIEDIYTYAKSNCSGLDKVTFIISPPGDNNISKKDNICIKEGLPKHRKSLQNTANQTANHRKSGSSDFNDATTDRKSPQNTTNHNK